MRAAKRTVNGAFDPKLSATFSESRHSPHRKAVAQPLIKLLNADARGRAARAD